MTFQELAVNIRDLHNKYSRNPGALGYNPKTAFVIEFGVGMATLPMYGWAAGQLLCEGYAKGAFSLPPFDSLRTPEIGDAARLGNGGKMIRSIVSWLEDRGHKVSGADPNHNPFDRLASGLEDAIAVAGVTVSETGAELGLDRSTVYAHLRDGKLIWLTKGRICRKSVNEYKARLTPKNKRNPKSPKAQAKRALAAFRAEKKL
jgi:hypothetical protein